MRRYTRGVTQASRAGPRLAALPLLALFAALSLAGAQPAVDVELGLGGNVVVGAWNPLRVVARDVPLGSRVEMTFDQGTLRTGEVPFRLQLPVSGGPGLSVVEHTVYVAPFSSVTWALLGGDGVVASGSLLGRDQDARPLDVVLSRRSGSYTAAFGSNARVVDVAAAQLPLVPAAYDGVRSVIVDGTGAAPRLEALAAAAAAGAVVVVVGEMPASHAEVRLLASRPRTPVGAGAVLAVEGSPADVGLAVERFTAGRPSRPELVAAAAARPLVTPPAPLRQQLVVVAAVVFSAFAVTATRLFGAPGLASALLVAGLVSGAAWLYARPTEPQVVGARTLALVGGELALATRLEERFTLPATTIAFPGLARPLDARPYLVDDAGLRLDLPGWRSVVLVMAPELVDAPLAYEGGRLVNSGAATLSHVLVVGLGPQADLAPGAGAALSAGEDGPPHEAYASLLPLLPSGSVVALSGCEVACTVWLAPGLVDLEGVEVL